MSAQPDESCFSLEPMSGKDSDDGVIMATQYFKRNLLLNLYREGKNIASLFPPAA